MSYRWSPIGSHMKLDVKELNCDFLVFSGHKMLGPSGIGVLYIKEDLYERMEPFLLGGSTIKKLYRWIYFWRPTSLLRGGTPEYRRSHRSWDCHWLPRKYPDGKCLCHDKALMELALERMGKIKNLEIYGSKDGKERLCRHQLHVNGMGCHGSGKILSLRENIMIRSGFHCAQPCTTGGMPKCESFILHLQHWKRNRNNDWTAREIGQFNWRIFVRTPYTL